MAFERFCGGDPTESTGSEWNLEITASNVCLVDLVNASIQATFLAAFTVTLVVFGCCASLLRRSAGPLVTFPGHDTRWILTILLLVVLTGALGEGVMTDLTRNAVTQPHLYVPQVLALTNCVLSIVYYHHLERWNRPTLSWLLLLYWQFAIGEEALRLVNLSYGGDFTILRFYIVSCCIAIYGFLLVVELNLIRTKVFKWCYCEPPRPIDLTRDDMYCLYRYTALLSRVLFVWLNWLPRLGYKRPIQMTDLGCLPQEHVVKRQHSKLKNAYDAEKRRAADKGTSLSLILTFARAYGGDICFCIAMVLTYDTVGLVSPIAVGGIVAYASSVYNGEPSPEYDTEFVTVSEFFSNGFVLIGAIFVSSCLRALCYQVLIYNAILNGMRVRTALQSHVYEKSLRLSSWMMSSGEMTMGVINNHISTDPTALQWWWQIVPLTISLPYLIVVVLTLLYIELGVAALVGASVFLITTPLQMKLATELANLQKRVMTFADDRVKKSNALLQGMKLLKLYSWEEIFCTDIEKVRAKEVHEMIKIGGLYILQLVLSQGTPVVMTLLSFGIYSATSGGAMTPALVFSALALFNQLQHPLRQLPMVINYTANAFVGLKRLEKFFVAAEIVEHADGRAPLSQCSSGNEGSGDGTDKCKDADQDTVGFVGHAHSATRKRSDSTENLLLGVDNDHRHMYGTFNEETALASQIPPLKPGVAIQVTNGNFSWDIEGDCPILSDITVDIPAGKLTIVVGRVGSGKSSLLSAILGEMTTLSGHVLFDREKSKVSYSAQKAWIQNASVRDNILFGEEYDDKRYSAVVEACALQPDIDILPAGDMTEIGEKGVNLSGGQKQRISVARAIYAKTDVVMLDDPMASLDVHVGGHVFNEGISNLLLVENRTVILVTHQVRYVNAAHKVIVVDDGKIQRQGNLTAISKHEPALYAEWMKTMAVISESENEVTSDDREDSVALERERLLKGVSKTTQKDDQDESSGRLIEKEKRAEGSISLKVYWAYIRAMRIPFAALALTLLVAQSAALMATNFWLASWSSSSGTGDNSTSQEDFDAELRYYLSGYTVLSVIFILLVGVASGAFVIVTILAAKRLHVDLLRSIVHAPMRFFDTTPVGRIINRFASDTNTIDQRLWNSLNSLLLALLQVLSVVVVNIIIVPIFTVFLIPLVIAVFGVEKYYLPSAREIQRLDSVTKSPVFAHFSETMGGLSTIRAYRCERRFREQLHSLIDHNNVAFNYATCISRWFFVRLESIAICLVFTSAMVTLVSCVLGLLEPSAVGLAITYSITLSVQLNILNYMMVATELQMNAVERVEEYQQIEPEHYPGILIVPSSWPEDGDIIMENVSVNYAAGLQPVLTKINLHFQAGKKIGICGRTGGGKSSMMLALFRIINICEGRIFIDNIDISHVPLRTLRSRLAIIPQDPVLFAGTIRFNLDPTGGHTDDELWRALEIAQLTTTVSELELQLDSEVSDDGENFSLGERQLFCIARAFLRNARILIMDEATASVDLKTDAVLQEVVATAFADKTVLTIAHRISTILDSDMVLVLSQGKAVEYDTPQNLLSKDGGMFASLVQGSQ